MVATMKTSEGMATGQKFMQATHMTVAEMQPMMAMAEPSMIGVPCARTIP
jgi:hypothetical protein